VARHFGRLEDLIKTKECSPNDNELSTLSILIHKPSDFGRHMMNRRIKTKKKNKLLGSSRRRSLLSSKLIIVIGSLTLLTIPTLLHLHQILQRHEHIVLKGRVTENYSTNPFAKERPIPTEGDQVALSSNLHPLLPMPEVIPINDIMNDHPALFKEICDIYVPKLDPSITFGTSNRTRIICSEWGWNPIHDNMMVGEKTSSDLLTSLFRDAGNFIYVTVHGDQTPIGSPSRNHYGGRPTDLSLDTAKVENKTPHANSFLQLDNLKYWFVPNAVVDHPKLITFPIGLKPKNRKAISRAQKALSPIPRLHQLLINFGALGHHGNERKYIKDNLSLWKSFSYVRWPETIQGGYEEFLGILKNSTFIFSPPGTGWDCYRTYESLLVGTIPIVLNTNTSFDNLFSHLPVLLVDSYEQVTESFLRDSYEILRTKSFKYDVLKVSYWKEKLLTCVISLITSIMMCNSHLLMWWEAGRGTIDGFGR